MKFSPVMKSFLRSTLSFILHAILLVGLLCLFYPLANWYISHRPILGVDFYLNATMGRFFRDNFEILPRGFFNIWYGGSPTLFNVIFIWYLVFGLVAHILPLLLAIKYSVITALFLLLVSQYLAAFRLSKNHFISLVIAVLTAYSANMYGSLVWGGSLSYFSNQLFFPLILWLLASYLDTGNKRWYWMASIILGLALLGHILNGMSFVLVGGAVVLLCGSRKTSVSIRTRIKDVFLFFLGGYLIAYRMTQGILMSFIDALLRFDLSGFGIGVPKTSIPGTLSSASGKTVVAVDQLTTDIATFHRSLFYKLFSDTNQWLFMIVGGALVLALVALFLGKRRRALFKVFPWFLLVIYSLLHVYLNANGFKFMAQGWYRAFWHFPITLGLFGAALIRISYEMTAARLKWLGYTVFITVALFSVGLLVFLYEQKESIKTIALLEQISSPASAHPEAINLVMTDDDLAPIKKQLIPSWLPPGEKQFRLLTSDAQINVWWNALFDIPLARGYLDYPVGISRQGHLFLMGEALTGDGLVNDFKYPVDTAKNMALYYMDWYAIKYVEGGHLSKSPNKGVSSYLQDIVAENTQTEAKGAYILYETKSGKPEVWEDVPQYLNFYRFNDEQVTPVLSISNAPVVVCVCDYPAYESLTKALAMNNINSQMLVTVFLDRPIDELSIDEYKQFEAVVLANYRYRNRNKAFEKLTQYVNEGGKVFIDTGGEVPESKSQQLPSIFPFIRAERKGLGKEWVVTDTAEEVFGDIDFGTFSPLVFENNEWKFSYPVGDPKSGAEILLRQKDKPVLMRVHSGKGILVWSGMNFGYHIQNYTNVEESKVYVNLLQSLVPLKVHAITSGNPHFVNGRTTKFKAASSGKGILYKAEFFNDWSITVNGRNEKAYPAGPTSPGFIYVPLRNSGPVDSYFAYQGDYTEYFYWILSKACLIVLLDLVFFKGKFIGSTLNRVKNYAYIRLHRWWEREEDKE